MFRSSKTYLHDRSITYANRNKLSDSLQMTVSIAFSWQKSWLSINFHNFITFEFKWYYFIIDSGNGTKHWWVGHYAWWRHQMETFSALLAFWAGNSPVTGEFHPQRPVTRRFHGFFELRLNKRLSKQSWGWGFEMPSCSLWRHFNGRYNVFHGSRRRNITSPQRYLLLCLLLIYAFIVLTHSKVT